MFKPNDSLPIAAPVAATPPSQKVLATPRRQWLKPGWFVLENNRDEGVANTHLRRGGAATLNV
jgi:hypothetical protein